MEQKLLDLKEQFCKWYCTNKDPLDEFDSEELCYRCRVGEYIRFIRDDI